MRRVVEYVAKDGSVFGSQEECSSYERHANYEAALATFITSKFPDITQETMNSMEVLFRTIFEDPNSFAPVMEAAMPKPKRGRPKTKDKNSIIV